MLIKTFLGLTADLQPTWPLVSQKGPISKIQVARDRCTFFTGQHALSLAKSRQILAKIKAADLPIVLADKQPVYSIQVALKNKQIIIR
jgi:hypothetical protein